MYFYNTETGDSQWDRPVAKAKNKLKLMVKLGAFSGSVLEQEEDPWEEVYGDDGSSYWYNRATGESAWEHP